MTNQPETGWDDSGPSDRTERGPSKLALVAVALVALAAGAGTAYAVGHRGGGTVVSWERSGHTCVIAARGVPVRQLVGLAAWGQVT